MAAAGRPVLGPCEKALIAQLFRYLLVGVLNTALGFGVIFACMYLAGMSPLASNVVGYAVGIVVSYLLNKSYTFKSDARSRYELLRFLIVFAVAYAANAATLLFCIDVLAMHAALAQVVSSGVYIATSFLLNKYYVFRPEKPPAV